MDANGKEFDQAREGCMCVFCFLYPPPPFPRRGKGRSAYHFKALEYSPEVLLFEGDSVCVWCFCSAPSQSCVKKTTHRNKQQQNNTHSPSPFSERINATSCPEEGDTEKERGLGGEVNNNKTQTFPFPTGEGARGRGKQEQPTKHPPLPFLDPSLTLCWKSAFRPFSRDPKSSSPSSHHYFPLLV